MKFPYLREQDVHRQNPRFVGFMKRIYGKLSVPLHGINRSHCWWYLAKEIKKHISIKEHHIIIYTSMIEHQKQEFLKKNIYRFKATLFDKRRKTRVTSRHFLSLERAELQSVSSEIMLLETPWWILFPSGPTSLSSIATCTIDNLINRHKNSNTEWTWIWEIKNHFSLWQVKYHQLS